jgi:acyl carrier protein phosphodiesterase
MISDFVKGKKKLDYTPVIQRGIMLHRDSDQYTDTHPATREAKEIFRPHYRLYAGAFIDIVYDHFLALDSHEFTEQSLLDFSLDTYHKLEPWIDVTPPQFREMFPYMKQHNWLFNYRFPLAIQRSMGGLVRRSAYMEEASTAFRLFEEHYEELKSCYEIFFPFLKNYVIQREGEF